MRRLWTIALAIVAVAGACERSVDLGGSLCSTCVTDKDCAGGACAQFGGDAYCSLACPTGNECASDSACISLSTVSGDQINGCVPRGDICGPQAPSSPAVQDAGTCGALNGPSVTSACSSCSRSSRECQPNGCYDGWWCNTATRKCQAPPTTCATGGIGFDGGAPITGSVGNDGGTVSRLYFGVVGDTRPAVLDDTDGYPVSIISAIFSGLQSVHPMPPFVVSTGDYVFAEARGSEAARQLDVYLVARARYSGVLFPALGNQECAGATSSNCGAGSANGITNNYASFVSKMLAPIGKPLPYYAIAIDASDGAWTAKLVFVAANAWSDTQASWLEGALARPTTYTFVVRHEPAGVSAPGVGPSEAIMARHPYTLAIVGHAHTYGRTGSKQITVGNGGAPLTGGANYGYAIVAQRTDGTVQVDMLDYATGQADPSFRFAVRADGSTAP